MKEFENFGIKLRQRIFCTFLMKIFYIKFLYFTQPKSTLCDWHSPSSCCFVQLFAYFFVIFMLPPDHPFHGFEVISVIQNNKLIWGRRFTLKRSRTSFACLKADSYSDSFYFCLRDVWRLRFWALMTRLKMDIGFDLLLRPDCSLPSSESLRLSRLV